MGSIERFCQRMNYWCNVADLGYSQTDRWDIREGGNCDCSSLVIHCLREAGFDTGDATYTGDLSANLTARGWARLAPDVALAQAGDILLNDAQHVAAVVYGYGWDALVAEAWLDENGGIYYGRGGDQTGTETRVRQIYSYPWDCILRYEGEDDMQPSDLTNYDVPTVDEGEIPYWQEQAWTLKYSKETYYQLPEIKLQLMALGTAVQTLAAKIGADPYDVVNEVKKAVDEKLKTLKSPKIDYDALAAAVAAAIPSAPTKKEIVDELYKRLKA